MLIIRFYIDPQSSEPHIQKHGITEDQVREILENSGEDRPGAEGTRVAIGRTGGGRYLRIIYVPDPEPDSIFVITGYELARKATIAYRRRLMRKGKR